MQTQMEESELIRRIQQGEHELFSALYELHRTPVLAIACRLLQSQTEAEEVVSETFLKAFRQIHQFRGDALFSTWLYRIAVNESHNRQRKRSRETPFSPLAEDRPEIADEAIPMDERLIEQETLAILRKAMARLPSQDRLILTLRYDQEQSYEEIAAITALPVGTVGTRIFRAKRNVMRLMQEGGFAYE